MEYTTLVKGKGLISLILFGFIFCFCSAFQVTQNYKTLLLGRWDAQWVIKNTDLIKHSTDKMDGYMTFQDDGNVSVQASGFPGCIFSSDTIKNELMWKISNDSLHFFNQNDHFKLSYLIKTASDNHIELKLLDDIFVTLKR